MERYVGTRAHKLAQTRAHKLAQTRAQKLAQLLGPAGAEIGCDECFDLLDEFVELELAGLDADAKIPGLRAHLEGCSACREEHDSLVALVEEQRA